MFVVAHGDVHVRVLFAPIQRTLADVVAPEAFNVEGLVVELNLLTPCCFGGLQRELWDNFYAASWCLNWVARLRESYWCSHPRRVWLIRRWRFYTGCELPIINALKTATPGS